MQSLCVTRSWLEQRERQRLSCSVVRIGRVRALRRSPNAGDISLLPSPVSILLKDLLTAQTFARPTSITAGRTVGAPPLCALLSDSWGAL